VLLQVALLESRRTAPAALCCCLLLLRVLWALLHYGCCVLPAVHLHPQLLQGLGLLLMLLCHGLLLLLLLVAASTACVLAQLVRLLGALLLLLLTVAGLLLWWRRWGFPAVAPVVAAIAHEHFGAWGQVLGGFEVHTVTAQLVVMPTVAAPTSSRVGWLWT
jgi:hypothetical protein